jgi:hypothetical protein
MNTKLVSLYARWRKFMCQPEWWSLCISAGAWLFFIVTGIYKIILKADVSLIQLGHIAHFPALEFDSFWIFDSIETFAFWVFHWLLMIAAMMFPLLIGQIRTVAIRSFWFRRNRAIAFFVFGYITLWLLYGLVTEACLQLQRTILPTVSTFLVPLCFLVAACWQLTEQKHQSLVGCHLTIPLAPSGWYADFDCYRYGFRVASSCCMSCWSLMLINVATHHALWSMLLVSLISFTERFLLSPRQIWFFFALFAVSWIELFSWVVYQSPSIFL